MYACEEGYKEIVKILLSAGADVTLENEVFFFNFFVIVMNNILFFCIFMGCFVLIFWFCFFEIEWRDCQRLGRRASRNHRIVE